MRDYLAALAVKPNLKISAALIAFGGGPVCPSTATCATDKEIWEKSASAEAYWRVYQDWRAWTEEGIIDIAIPMSAGLFVSLPVLHPSLQCGAGAVTRASP